MRSGVNSLEGKGQGLGDAGRVCVRYVIRRPWAEGRSRRVRYSVQHSVLHRMKAGGMRYG